MTTRYSNSSIALHALHGFLITLILITGTFILSEIPNTLEKLSSIKMHIIVGLIISLLTILRIIVLVKSPKPQALNVSSFRAKLIAFNHIAIYVVILLIAITGILLAKGTGVGEMAIFGVQGEIYSSFKNFPMGIAHAVLTKILPLLIIMHIVGLFSYKIKTKEKVLSRMWFK